MSNFALVNDDQSINLTHDESTIKLSQNSNELILQAPRINEVKLSQSEHNLELKKADYILAFRQTNLRGLEGERGIGVPDGGQQGEVLIKGVGDSTSWGSFEGADKNYTIDFTNSSVIEVTHNLNKYPSATVIDSADDEVIGDIKYLSLNIIRVSFSGSFSGRITLN